MQPFCRSPSGHRSPLFVFPEGASPPSPLPSCTFCLEPLADGMVTAFSCGHSPVHARCCTCDAIASLQRSGCPICRAPIQPHLLPATVNFRRPQALQHCNFDEAVTWIGAVDVEWIGSGRRARTRRFWRPVFPAELPEAPPSPRSSSVLVDLAPPPPAVIEPVAEVLMAPPPAALAAEVVLEAREVLEVVPDLVEVPVCVLWLCQILL